MDNEVVLIDRIGVIQAVAQRFDLEHCAHLMFSGGKDSTVLHYLLDEALPGNRIPRVYVDTGIEYNSVREFVLKLATEDDRIHIIQPRLPIKKVLETYGYPFKSKEHARQVGDYQNGCRSRIVLAYKGGGKFGCPKCLLYQFTDQFKLKVSNKCCYYLKKKPAHSWASQNKRPIVITGMRKEEGGQRANIKGCVLTDGKGQLVKFHPLLVVDSAFEEWYAKKKGIRFASVYYPPFNFRRTGCKGCPFALDLSQQLTTMALYLPKERLQCEAIWKPVYDEYRRLGYRLDCAEQLTLF